MFSRQTLCRSAPEQRCARAYLSSTPDRCLRAAEGLGVAIAQGGRRSSGTIQGKVASAANRSVGRVRGTRAICCTTSLYNRICKIIRLLYSQEGQYREGAGAGLTDHHCGLCFQFAAERQRGRASAGDWRESEQCAKPFCDRHSKSDGHTSRASGVGALR